MKKYLFRIAFLGGFIIAANSYSASAQVYVSVRPKAPEMHKSKAPGPKYVWIGEDWTARGGKYVHTGGHWALPPHPGQKWNDGHWVHDRRGEEWVPGHWG